MIIYTSNTCPNCHNLMAALKRAGIQFEERNVDRNIAWRQELMSTGHRSVPLAFIGGQWRVGDFPIRMAIQTTLGRAV